MNDEKLGTGAHVSEEDPRTVKHEEVMPTEAVAPLVKGGKAYLPENIEHQHGVGICTAISFVQNREKTNGKKYSADFQYLLQKKFIDLNWDEGSSVFSALRVGKTYGLLPINQWTYTTEQDRYLPYSQYIAKLQAIPLSEVLRLCNLCVDKISGYAQVNVSDPQAIAKAINDSEAGILCRYGCGSTWWLPSWLSKDIDPIKKPIPETSGHAIIASEFDYTIGYMITHPNTWGTLWNWMGQGHINWGNYPMTEAWSILPFTPSINQFPTVRLGSRGVVVKDLQTKLNSKIGCNLTMDGIFGPQTLTMVKYYQEINKLVVDGVVGPKTWTLLNL